MKTTNRVKALFRHQNDVSDTCESIAHLMSGRRRTDMSNTYETAHKLLKSRYEIQVYDETVVTGNIAILHCIVPASVSEYITVTSWVQDNLITIFANNNLGDKYVVVGNRDLYIYNVSATDSYSGFICRTINQLTGDIQTSSYPARITVTEPEGNTPPKLLVERQSKKRIGINEHIVLSCVAQGYPVPTYSKKKWELSQQYHPTLVPCTLPNRGPQDYSAVDTRAEQTLQPGPPLSLKCVGTGNPLPTIEWKLDGFAIPDSSRSMPKITAISGGKLIIKCPVAGYPIESITWEQGGVLLPVNRRQRAYANGTLTIDQVQRISDAGTYTCQAQNRQKHSARREVEVQVLVPPKIMPIPPLTNLLQEGNRAGITCQVVEGDLPINFRWEKLTPSGRNVELGAVSRRIDEYTSSLIIEKITPSHSGNYTCVAQNNAGEERLVVPVTVNAAVYFKQKSKQLNILKGDQGHLQCNVLGDNPIDIIWKGSKNQIISDELDLRYSIREQILHEGKISELSIAKVFRHDTGTFTCQTKNNYGQDQMTIELIVQAVWTIDPSKVTVPSSKTTTIVENLTPANAYHFRILAENSIGLSEPSDEIQVTTQEEAPSGSPKDVKVLAKSSTELNISWEAPSKDLWNGNLLGYNIGYQEISEIIVQTTPSNSSLHYIMKTVDIGPDFGGQIVISGLNMFTMYSVVVQAFNSRGLGPFSDPITARTNEGVPSAPPENVQCMALTSQSIQISWNPPPQEGRNGLIQEYKVSYQPAEDWYVPSAPAGIKTFPSAINKIIVSWLPPMHKNGELTGYTFYMAMRSGGGEEEPRKKKFKESVTENEITRSQESATYQFWVTASTKVGEGESTSVVTVPPVLKVPARIVSFSQRIVTPWKKNITLLCRKVGIPPPKLVWKLMNKVLKSIPVSPMGVQQGMTYNTTAASVWLDMWNDGGCSISYFIIEYKRESDDDWKIMKSVSPSDRIYMITNLSPGIRYQLRITAQNNIGSTVQIYNFTTLSEEGGFNDLNDDVCDSMSVSTQNQRNRDQYCIKNSRSQQTLSADPASCKTDSTEYIDEICPYATFQLSKPSYSESTFSGNVYSGPYHSVGGSFVYHNVKSSTSSIKQKYIKDYEYTKVRRTGNKIKDLQSESQESDNFGSTDSEVKKILTLHLPISEYDTLGSDSEGDGRQTNNQELVSFRHIGPAREETSSSSEISPTDTRKPVPLPMRKSKNKNQFLSKRIKNNSGYSSHTEETTFSFSNRINPPSRFSDRPHSRVQNESGMDFRRSSRNSRFPQESSFQIDV
ncbi:hypothetical protein PGB90_000031 [Kerria lacca]